MLLLIRIFNIALMVIITIWTIKTIKDSNDFASYLLESALVAVVPGIAFGAEGFFRISYAASEEFLNNAMQRISDACNKLK